MYPNLKIPDVLDKLGKYYYLITLDLASGFYQVEMGTQDMSKTAFTIEQGGVESKKFCLNFSARNG